MEALISWAISALSGAIGGNLAGMVGKLKDLSPMVKTVGGALGGLIGGQGLGALGLLKDLGGHAGNAGASAIVGAIVPAIIGMMKKPSA